MDIYYIGGSPASGKSTIAKLLAKQFGFSYYKLDDYLFKYNKKAVKDGKEHSLLAHTLNTEQTWMRKPQLQMEEEIGIYEEIFPYALQDISNIAKTKAVVAEGAGFMPQLMAAQNIAKARYICIAPTEDFQRRVFAKRSFLKLFLLGCKDRKAAFNNWMVRDALFAKEILKQAQLLGYTSILVDGDTSIDDNYRTVKKIFGLDSHYPYQR